LTGQLETSQTRACKLPKEGGKILPPSAMRIGNRLDLFTQVFCPYRLIAVMRPPSFK
jgi:hypothetical protein